jgi:hypothetical protein
VRRAKRIDSDILRFRTSDDQRGTASIIAFQMVGRIGGNQGRTWHRSVLELVDILLFELRTSPVSVFI